MMETALQLLHSPVFGTAAWLWLVFAGVVLTLLVPASKNAVELKPVSINPPHAGEVDPQSLYKGILVALDASRADQHGYTLQRIKRLQIDVQNGRTAWGARQNQPLAWDRVQDEVELAIGKTEAVIVA